MISIMPDFGGFPGYILAVTNTFTPVTHIVSGISTSLVPLRMFFNFRSATFQKEILYLLLFV